jgi:hypothetical protein
MVLIDTLLAGDTRGIDFIGIQIDIGIGVVF